MHTEETGHVGVDHDGHPLRCEGAGIGIQPVAFFHSKLPLGARAHNIGGVVGVEVAVKPPVALHPEVNEPRIGHSRIFQVELAVHERSLPVAVVARGVEFTCSIVHRQVAFLLSHGRQAHDPQSYCNHYFEVPLFHLCNFDESLFTDGAVRTGTCSVSGTALGRRLKKLRQLSKSCL